MSFYTLNQELNGIEITFESKPEAVTLEALKAAGYRWHRAKKVWYAKQNAERLNLAKSITGGEEIAPKAATVESINLENLGQNAPSLYGAELAAAIREDLKRRGVKGVTVRARKVTHETGITVTIKADESNLASLEEMRERFSFSEFAFRMSHGVYIGSRWLYSNEFEQMTEEEKKAAYDEFLRYQGSKAAQINEHHLENCRNDYFTITTAFYNKVVAVYKIANQWNWNRSDSMTDYFDIGYFLDIDVKIPDGFTPREEMTEEERTAYAAEVAAEEARKAAELAAYQAQQEESHRQAERAEKRRQEQRETIKNGITVTDLTESEFLYITNLHGGVGKECNLTELEETFTSGHYTTEDAVITRRVDMNEDAFEAFGELLLDDFDFLREKGGQASEDVRLENVHNLWSMTSEQRETVKWYLCDCVGIYVNNELRLVCDPEGYSYSRYTFKPSSASKYRKASEVCEEQKNESETKTAFYFPAPVAEQAESIKEGEQITII